MKKGGHFCDNIYSHLNQEQRDTIQDISILSLAITFMYGN